MFAQPFDHAFNDLFSQYVDMDSSMVDGNKDVSIASDFDQIFALDSLSSDCGDHSPPVPTKPTHQSPQPWAADLWSVPQDAASSASQGSFTFQDTVHPSAVSDLSFHLEALPTSHPAPAVTCKASSRSPSTPPATPRHKATKSALVTPKSIRRHRDSHERKPLRKQSFSPSLMRPSQLQAGRMMYPEAWAQRFQNFSLHSSDEHLPLSPPPSDILVQHENIPADNVVTRLSHSTEGLSRNPAEMPSHYETGIFNQSPAISMPSPSAKLLAAQQQQQQQNYLSQSNNSTMATSSPPSGDDIFSSPHSSDPQSLSSWHSDSLGGPALPFTPDLQGHDGQAWWPSMPSRVPRQPSYQHVVSSPAPQRSIQSNSQHDLMQGGLMIQFDSSFDVSTSADPSFSSAVASAPMPQENQNTYNHIPITPQKYMNSSAYATPPVQHPSRSPSLSPRGRGSPTQGSPLRNGVHTKTSPHRRGNHGRKLSSQSMSAPKPVKGPNSSPRAGSNKSLTVSFVNFTPNDSKKILTGVAPSGSSKTKARREQEARDRRRKLSEAAINAVRKAGGDVEALEAVLC
ncbi:hypothetical protein Asppvi_000262 [Aspergillus pseudoviridinutans]|uniref:Developmental regulatory protein wetA n=1 Tax=Aspergillus pseudoviridinutans TaxID=1517512 RepID=A0A9P3ENW4_9EURO|nr:uncharacterized protein Asppvi_000262 [Aspergillus pseudoviridinutans]GIJ81761.1 hypothetical protein Asppvi_000262 [Aspergillus pseudoviridinutans]